MQYALALLLLTQSATEFVIPAAEEKFAADVAKAENDLAKVKQAASAARLKVYKDKLSEATKAGDFDKATQIKARIESLESEPDAKAHKRPRPKNAVRFDGHAYALIKEPATWHVAKQRCEEMGGHLVCIGNQAEAEFLLKLCGDESAWVGASDEETEGQWKWINGDPVSMRFDVNNQEGFDHCMVIWQRHFADGTAGRRYGYICEWAK